MIIRSSTNCRPATRTRWKPWIASIRKEEALASVADHSVTEIDQWEQAHFDEEEMRTTVKAAKEKYEDALRTKFFGF